MTVVIKQAHNPPAAHNIFTCEQCGEEAHRRLGGSNARNRFCSMDCRKAKAAGLRAERKEQADGLSELKRIARLFKSFPPPEPKPPSIKPYTCIDCSMAYTSEKYLYGSKVVCQPCSDMRKQAKKSASALRAYEVRKAHKVKEKAVRRARMRINAEAVNPTKVFDRDRWMCQLCGINTPKNMRGKNKPNSPELDHVIPLAVGGSHTWANLQCLCRACNGAKGCRPLGQIGLGFGV